MNWIKIEPSKDTEKYLNIAREGVKKSLDACNATKDIRKTRSLSICEQMLRYYNQPKTR